MARIWGLPLTPLGGKASPASESGKRILPWGSGELSSRSCFWSWAFHQNAESETKPPKGCVSAGARELSSGYESVCPPILILPVDTGAYTRNFVSSLSHLYRVLSWWMAFPSSQASPAPKSPCFTPSLEQGEKRSNWTKSNTYCSPTHVLRSLMHSLQSAFSVSLLRVCLRCQEGLISVNTAWDRVCFSWSPLLCWEALLDSELKSCRKVFWGASWSITYSVCPWPPPHPPTHHPHHHLLFSDCIAEQEWW